MKLFQFSLTLFLMVSAIAELPAYSILTKPEKPVKVEVLEQKQEASAIDSSAEVVEEEPLSYSIENMFCEDNPNTDIFQAQFATICHEGRDRKRFVLVLKNIARSFLSIGVNPRISASEESIDAFIDVTKEEQKEDLVREALLIGTTYEAYSEFGDCERVYLKVSHPFYNCFENSLSYEIFVDCDETFEEKTYNRIFLLVEQK